MRDLPILMDVMPPCLCKSKVIGYEYSEDGFNITHCACGGVIACEEIEDVEVKKPFDITKHEFSEGLSISNMCKLSVEVKFSNNDDSNYVPLHKDDVIAIAIALGVTGEDLK